MAKRLGRAHALPGQCWAKWTKYFYKNAPRKYYYILVLIEALCVRVTQICQLTVADVDLRRRRVWLKPFKRHRGVWKPLLPSVVETIRSWKSKGWKWPRSGYLFPSQKGSKHPHVTKDIVARHVKQQRKSFVQKFSEQFPELRNGLEIRTHSGRRHAISELAGAGVPQHIGMAWSQIESPKVYQSYVDLEPKQVYATMVKHDKKKVKKTAMKSRR